MVLLKNNGFLPLKLETYKSVAVVGPCADDPVCNRGTWLFMCMFIDYTLLNVSGDYDPQPAYIVTPRAAFTNRSGLTVSTI